MAFWATIEREGKMSGGVLESVRFSDTSLIQDSTAMLRMDILLMIYILHHPIYAMIPYFLG